MKVSELEAYLSSFKLVYKDLGEWKLETIKSSAEPIQEDFIKPVMPDLDPTGTNFDLKDKL